ncbi:hypothetical protein GP486_003147 [Trichoglossum hirsutum]|uniref:Heterokaryon incompatibility domain-containing protein n=1 Tax=Trichoglossum hirsutum TaxID=265104 RepID=A0A9P8LDN1_9PEZI|nr:hypothetical protein GP486_003147 [Trichoglossum hirsutum]
MSGTDLNPQEAELPSRCIGVTGHGKAPKLVKTGGKTGCYLTLSHRWGRDTYLCRTTQDNYDERLKGKGMGNLPQLFQDAILVAERLEIPYIWIDSICIIQPRDGEKQSSDWLAESTKMAKYYQGSLFTIAATSGSDFSGLFPERVVSERKIVRLPYRDAAGQQRGYFYLLYPLLDMEGEYQEAVHRSSLLTRGWVFQEWLLSRRVVCYTPIGTFFECQSSTPKTELGEAGSQDGGRNLILKQYFDFGRANDSLFWHEIVAAYSRLDLTDKGDRLKALSGVASEFYQLLRNKWAASAALPGQQRDNAPDRYISGIWQRDIHHGLLWKSADDQTSFPKSADFPTWSWASTQAQVIWRNTRGSCPKPRHPDLEIVRLRVGKLEEQRVPIPALGNDPLDVGKLVSGLEVNGITQRIRVGAVWNAAADIPDYYYDQRMPQPEESLGLHEPKIVRQIYHPSAPTIVCGWGSFEDSGFQPVLAFMGAEVMALLVSTIKKADGGLNAGYLTPWQPAYDVLFIRLAENNQYRRVGMGYLWGREMRKGFLDDPRRTLELI